MCYWSTDPARRFVWAVCWNKLQISDFYLLRATSGCVIGAPTQHGGLSELFAGISYKYKIFICCVQQVYVLSEHWTSPSVHLTCWLEYKYRNIRFFSVAMSICVIGAPNQPSSLSDQLVGINYKYQIFIFCRLQVYGLSEYRPSMWVYEFMCYRSTNPSRWSVWPASWNKLQI